MANSMKDLIVALYCVAMLNVPAACAQEPTATPDLPVAGGPSQGVQPGVQQPASTLSSPEQTALKVGGTAQAANQEASVAHVEDLPAFGTALVILGDVPLLSVNGSREANLTRASEISARVNRLGWERVAGESIRVTFDGKHYAVVAGEDLAIVTIDSAIRLSRSVEFSPQDTALQVANRLRRFFGNAPALSEAPVAEREAAEPESLGSKVVKVFQGIASWYGEQFMHRRTSSGEILRPESLIAAHRALPFGTLLRVTNLTNGRQVTVKVQDRGPFVHGRVIDLSERAARILGMINSGVARVKIEIMR